MSLNSKITGVALAAAFLLAGTEVQAQSYDDEYEEYDPPCETLETVGDFTDCHQRYFFSPSQPSLSALPTATTGTAAPNTMADAYAVIRSAACQESKSINQQIGMLLDEISAGSNPDLTMESAIPDDLKTLALAFLSTEPDCLLAFADVIENNIPGRAFVAEGYRERVTRHTEIAAKLTPGN